MIRRIRHGLWLALLFIFCQWLAPASMTPLRSVRASVAGISCSATITGISFGNVDPSYWGLGYYSYNGNSNLQTTGFLTYYCTNTTGVQQGVDICVSINNPGGTAQRAMNGPNGGTLNYQLYQDASNTTSWGSKSTGKWGTPYVATTSVPANGTSAPVTVPIYATIAKSQVAWYTTNTGAYNATYGSGDVAIDTGPAGRGCNGASGGGSITGFTVSANMQATCQVNTNPLTFPSSSITSGGSITASTTLTVNCTDGDTGYQVGLDNGKNYDGTNRRMRGGPTHSEYISYGLYTDSGYTNAWGNTYGTNTFQLPNQQATQQFTIYGKVLTPTASLPTPGNYFDAVTVYVYY